MGTNYNPKIVTDGLVMCLDAANKKSYPGSGTTWADLTGLGNNSVLTNGPTFNSENGGSIVFDGIDDYGDIPTTNGLNNQYATHEVWVKPTSATPANNQQILARTNTSVGTFNIVQLGFNSGILSYTWQVNLRDSSNVQTFINSNDLSTTNWTHVMTTYNGTVHNLYINGVKQTNETVKTNTINTSGTFLMNIARNTSAMGVFAGRIAIVRVYNRGLTAEEVVQNFNATRGRFGV
jgi:hypothetical protein